jgi:Ca2+-binding EF-hand superfamily protein
VGTTSYIAPNVLEGNYRSDCDLWSVGVIAFALLTGKMPFGGPEQQRERDILEGRWDASPSLWGSCSADALDFVRSLLVVQSSARLTAPQALAHKWMVSHCPKRIASIDGPIIDSLRTFAGASHFRRACWSVMAWCLTAEERETIKDAFLAMDVSKSGTIHLWEMRQVLMDRGVSAQESSFFFETLNMERNTELGYSDFLAAMCASRITLREHHVKETFRRFDCDNSGRITYDNLHDVFCTPLDDPEVNAYFANLAGDDGLDETALEAVLRADGHLFHDSAALTRL